jgi:hypothetical protein
MPVPKPAPLPDAMTIERLAVAGAAAMGLNFQQLDPDTARAHRVVANAHLIALGTLAQAIQTAGPAVAVAMQEIADALTSLESRVEALASEEEFQTFFHAKRRAETVLASALFGADQEQEDEAV